MVRTASGGFSKDSAQGKIRTYPSPASSIGRLVSHVHDMLIHTLHTGEPQ